MRLTFGDLVLAERALRAIGAVRFPPPVALKLRVLTTLVAAETRGFHAQEQQWIRELGEAQPDGSIAITAPEQRAVFFSRLQELAAVALDDRAWPTVTLADLETGEDPETHMPAKYAPGDLVLFGVLLSFDAAVQKTEDTDDESAAAQGGMVAVGEHRARDGVAGPA